MNQVERIRAELNARMKDGESLQKLFHYIRRLMALAYPGLRTELSEVVARALFFADLQHKRLLLRIKNPERHATRMEAYSYGPDGSEKDDWFGTKDKKIRMVSVDDDALAKANEKLN